ncbi:MAG: tetratricopeptide repeat protein [Nannocystaceae bacterium]|nr:tetratricopeptide repeat protein [bacterium]
MSETDALIDRGLAAVEDENIEAAKAALDEAVAALGEDNARVLHLRGMLSWAQDDLETATTTLLKAADLDAGRPEIHFDCAECLYGMEEIEEAEEQVRKVLELPDVPGEQADDARLLLAQLRLTVDDPQGALEALEGIDASRKTHPAYLGALGSALLADEQFDEAVETLRSALSHDEEDSDLHYQVGIALEAVGDAEGARAAMKTVLALDEKEWADLGDDAPPPPDFAETQELRSRLEEVLEGLPDPVLKLVAAAPITVQARATAEQVDGGVDPRGTVVFVGEPKSDEDEAELEGIVIMRDLVLTQVDDDDGIDEELFYSLLEQIQHFFRRDDIIVAQA